MFYYVKNPKKYVFIWKGLFKIGDVAIINVWSQLCAGHIILELIFNARVGIKPHIINVENGGQGVGVTPRVLPLERDSWIET